MKKTIVMWLICFHLLCLCGCDTDYVLGKDLFRMPEQVGGGVVIRHAGYSLGFYSEQPQKAASYVALIKQMKIRQTDRKGSLTSEIYEIRFDSVICDEVTYEIQEVIPVWLVIDEDLILYNGQWYEADTSRLLRQLEKDFS